MVVQILTAPELVTALMNWSSHLSTRSLFSLRVMAPATQFSSVFCNKGAENQQKLTTPFSILHQKGKKERKRKGKRKERNKENKKGEAIREKN